MRHEKTGAAMRSVKHACSFAMCGFPLSFRSFPRPMRIDRIKELERTDNYPHILPPISSSDSGYNHKPTPGALCEPSTNIRPGDRRISRAQALLENPNHSRTNGLAMWA